MLSKKLLASLAAISLGAVVYSSLDAAPIFPPQAGHAGPGTFLTRATATFFDYVDEGHAPQGAPIPSLLQDYRWVGPSAGHVDSMSMVLASLGLMAVIAHRRRDI
jgi:hypothetical protein